MEGPRFTIQQESKKYPNSLIETELKTLLEKVDKIKKVEYLKIIGKGNSLFLETKVEAYKDENKNDSLGIKINSTLTYIKGKITASKPDIEIFGGFMVRTFGKGLVEKAIDPHIEKTPQLLKEYIQTKEGKEVEKIEIENGELKVVFKKPKDNKIEQIEKKPMLVGPFFLKIAKIVAEEQEEIIKRIPQPRLISNIAKLYGERSSSELSSEIEQALNELEMCGIIKINQKEIIRLVKNNSELETQLQKFDLKFWTQEEFEEGRNSGNIENFELIDKTEEGFDVSYPTSIEVHNNGHYTVFCFPRNAEYAKSASDNSILYQIKNENTEVASFTLINNKAKLLQALRLRSVWLDPVCEVIADGDIKEALDSGEFDIIPGKAKIESNGIWKVLEKVKIVLKNKSNKEMEKLKVDGRVNLKENLDPITEGFRRAFVGAPLNNAEGKIVFKDTAGSNEKATQNKIFILDTKKDLAIGDTCNFYINYEDYESVYTVLEVMGASEEDRSGLLIQTPVDKNGNKAKNVQLNGKFFDLAEGVTSESIKTIQVKSEWLDAGGKLLLGIEILQKGEAKLIKKGITSEWEITKPCKLRFVDKRPVEEKNRVEEADPAIENTEKVENSLEETLSKIEKAFKEVSFSYKFLILNDDFVSCVAGIKEKFNLVVPISLWNEIGFSGFEKVLKGIGLDVSLENGNNENLKTFSISNPDYLKTRSDVTLEEIKSQDIYTNILKSEDYNLSLKNWQEKARKQLEKSKKISETETGNAHYTNFESGNEETFNIVPETNNRGTEVVPVVEETGVVSTPNAEIVKVENKEVKPETIFIQPSELNEGLKEVFEKFKEVFEKQLLTAKQSLEYYGGVSTEISKFFTLKPYFRFNTIPKSKVYDLGITLSYEFKEGALVITNLSWPNNEDLPRDLEVIRRKIFDKLKESLTPELEKAIIEVCKKKYPEGEDILSFNVERGALDIKFGVKDEKEKVKDEARRGIRRIISEIKKFKTIDLKTSEEDLRVYMQKLGELKSFIDKVGLLDEHRHTYDSYKKSLIDVIFNKYEMKSLTVANKEIKSWHEMFGSGTVFLVVTEYDIKSLTEKYFEGDKKELLTALKNTKKQMEKEGIELNSNSSLNFILTAETKEVAIKNLGTDKAKENFIALSFYKNKTIDDMIAFLEKETEDKKELESPKEEEGEYIDYEEVGSKERNLKNLEFKNVDNVHIMRFEGISSDHNETAERIRENTKAQIDTGSFRLTLENPKIEIGNKIIYYTKSLETGEKTGFTNESGEVVSIEKSESTENFYKVTTNTGEVFFLLEEQIGGGIKNKGAENGNFLDLEETKEKATIEKEIVGSLEIALEEYKRENPIGHFLFKKIHPTNLRVMFYKGFMTDNKIDEKRLESFFKDKELDQPVKGMGFKYFYKLKENAILCDSFGFYIKPTDTKAIDEAIGMVETAPILKDGKVLYEIYKPDGTLYEENGTTTFDYEKSKELLVELSEEYLEDSIDEYVEKKLEETTAKMQKLALEIEEEKRKIGKDSKKK